MPKIHFRSLPTGPYSVAVSQNKSTIEAQFGALEKPPQPTKPTGQIGTATIEVNRRQGTAPAGFFFSIKTEGWSNGRDDFDPYYDLHYRWEFSDPGHYTRHDTDDLPWGRWYDVAGERVMINDGTVPKGDGDVTFLGNDKNIAYGPHVSHTFDPGHTGSFNQWSAGEISQGYRDCIVRCEIRMSPTDADPLLTVRETIRVNHPDSVFPANRTFLVANSSTPVGDEPAHSGTIYTTMAAAAAATNGGGGSVRRVLLRRGQDHDVWTNDDKIGGSSRNKVMLGAYGPTESSAPRIVYPDDVDWSVTQFPFRDTLEAWEDPPTAEVIISGIDFDTGYDPSNPYGVNYQPPAGVELRTGGFRTIWDTSFSGFMEAIPTQRGNKSDFHVGNTLVKNYCNYGVYAGGGVIRWGFSGFWIKQHPEAVKGPGFVSSYPFTTPPFTVGHTTIRIEQPVGPVALNLIDFMNVAGNGSPHQPVLRLNRAYPPAPPPESVVDRMRVEGGQPIVLGGGDAAASRNPQNPGRFVYDKVYCIMQHSGMGPPIDLQITGSCIRNFIAVSPSNTAYITGIHDATDPVNTDKKGNAEFLRVRMTTEDVLYSDAVWEYDVRVYNCTFVHLKDAADQRVGDNVLPGVNTSEVGQRVYTQNNVWAFPNGTPNAAHDPSFDYYQGAGSNFVYVPDGSTIESDWLDLTPLFEPGQKGFSFLEWYDADPATAFRTVYGSDPNDAPILTPKAGTPLAGGADTDLHVSVDDFFGRIRGANPSRGAVESL